MALVHAALVWVALQWRMPVPASDDESALAVIFISKPALPPSTEPVRPPTRRDRVTAPSSLVSLTREPVRASREATPTPAAPAVQEPSSGLTAVQIGPSRSTPTRAPWDEPAIDLLERRAPDLPGHATQRFKMQSPRSLANVVERVGRVFGGRGEDPCKRTRANIDGLGAQGDSADLQRELEYERRYCRP